MSSSIPVDIAARRTARRRAIEESDLHPSLKLLLLQNGDHADEEVDVYRDGFARLETATRQQTRVGMALGAAGFALVAFLAAGIMLVRGVDPGEAADAAGRVVADGFRGSGSGGADPTEGWPPPGATRTARAPETSEDRSEAPAAQPGPAAAGDGAIPTAGADRDGDAPYDAGPTP